MKAYSILFAVFFVFVNSLEAQQSISTNEYLINKVALSPANAGLHGASEIYTSYREQWHEIPNSPVIGGVSGHMALKKNAGVGFKISMQNSGIFNQLNANAIYAYHVKMGEWSYLSFGLAAGLKRVSIDLSDPDMQSDPAVGQTQVLNGRLLDAEFGIDYSSRTFFAGISIPQLATGYIDGYNATGNKSTLYSLKRQYRGYLSNSFVLDKNWHLQPLVVINKTESTLMYDVNALFKFRNQLWVGGTYKSNGATCAIVGFQYNRLLVNYSYEFSNKGIMSVGGATHDIALGFIIGRNNPKLAAPVILKGLQHTPPYRNWE